MNASQMRAYLAISVFTVFLVGSAFIALVPIVRGLPADAYTEHLKTFTAMYSGVVGAIIGYYFGKQDANSPEKSPEGSANSNALK